jgi:hypothetical protein
VSSCSTQSAVVGSVITASAATGGGLSGLVSTDRFIDSRSSDGRVTADAAGGCGKGAAGAVASAEFVGETNRDLIFPPPLPPPAPRPLRGGVFEALLRL